MDHIRNRREPRRSLLIYLDCTDEKKSEEAGKIVDITAEGFLLASEQPVRAGSVSRYRIGLPGFREFSGRELSADGICRWSRKEEMQQIYYSGIEFTDPGKIDAGLIDLLIRKIGFSDGQKKIFTAPGDIEYK